MVKKCENFSSREHGLLQISLLAPLVRTTYWH